MDAVNFQSLNMVRDELVATIEESARNLEVFVTTQDDGESLQMCIDGVKQIVGILRLIQFQGACLLAEELLATANEIMPGNSGKKFEKRLEVVSSAFFVLTRYLEYVQQIERKVPVLLIPIINDLRKLRGEPALPESHFFNFDITSIPKLPKVSRLDLGGEKHNAVIRRVRHMYQVGLLGMLKDKQLKNSQALMRRALIRLHRLGGSDKQLSILWWLGQVALSAIDEGNMDVLETRKLLFGRIDRVIRQLESAGEGAYNATPPRGLVKELVYLSALSGVETPEVKVVLKTYKITVFPYSDSDLAEERKALNGPSAHTVASLSKVLQTELSSTKKVLESAAESNARRIDDLSGFISALDKVAEILAIVGLNSAAGTLKEEIKRIHSWREKTDGIESEEMAEVANTLLYLESTVASLESTKLSDERLEQANKVAQEKAVASSELAQAERIVVEEAEAGLSLTKRALNSFSESDYDTGHIRNISKTLNAVRGGMIMLKKERAARILAKCVDFVDNVLMSQDQPPALKELLETFADAVIAVEYYLDSATALLQMDDSVLQLAEESLEALGYAVDS